MRKIEESKVTTRVSIAALVEAGIISPQLADVLCEPASPIPPLVCTEVDRENGVITFDVKPKK